MYLKIKQLSKNYGSRPVVSNVDMTMEEGEILSLLGPSGCGKTTILRMIAGLITPTSGSIEVGDRVFYDGSRELPVEERDLGMVFQDYALWPHMTVFNNIAFGLQLRRKPRAYIKKRVEELLELVNLPGMGKRYPYQLSGGQQQRVSVARALATAPRLLLLDEPLSSLDTSLRETMGAELVQLFKQLKITAINVTHDQNEAMTMSDRIVVLRDGQIQQVGTPTDLYLQPTNKFVASFMGPVNTLQGQLVQQAESSLHIQLDNHYFDNLTLLGSPHQASHDLRIDQQVHLICRPANILLHPEVPHGEHPNIFAGTVTYSSFVGGRWRTLVEVGNGEKQHIQAFAASQYQLQAKVWVELPPEHCLVVP
ncbi:ABC transporter ATP-binding protein [Ktedonobacter racemifer]|uniref:ABC-type quaternary amine transporter n=1 Tax=Ktedonobacter racemifer DSM 44963 TaxID=485913 RepID=D6U2B2_KTERA|nr:ABC transporter ATP-binding protein [Ktedonobacter racemifer]EFH82780.1 ABC transporter related protein [Ktedonobacter racemifer DSM 44963]